MVTVINTFGATKEEVEAVKAEAERLQAMGYNVPAEVEIKFISNANGLSGTMRRMYIHPNTDLTELKFVVRHEIGHHNEPEVEFDLWSEPVDHVQVSEDFANDFAKQTA